MEIKENVMLFFADNFAQFFPFRNSSLGPSNVYTPGSVLLFYGSAATLQLILVWWSVVLCKAVIMDIEYVDIVTGEYLSSI